MNQALHLSLEEVGKLNEQDQDHQNFEPERARLVKFIDQKSIKVFGSAKLPLRKALIVVHADFGCCQAIEAR
jgi:hypothetical protein